MIKGRWTGVLQAATVALRAWDAATEESEARPVEEDGGAPEWPATSMALQHVAEEVAAAAHPSLENGVDAIPN